MHTILVACTDVWRNPLHGFAGIYSTVHNVSHVTHTQSTMHSKCMTCNPSTCTVHVRVAVCSVAVCSVAVRSVAVRSVTVRSFAVRSVAVHSVAVLTNQ